MAQQKLVTRSRFAEICGVSAAATTKACRTTLAAATVGKRIDMAHPDAVAYIQKHDDGTTKKAANDAPPAKKKAAKKPPPPPAPVVRGRGAENQNKKNAALANLNNGIENGKTLHEIPDDIKAFADMTLRELIIRFGTDIAFKDWLAATKQIEDINEKRLKNAATKGELVSRDLVKNHIVEPIDAALQKLLTDGAKTMAKRVDAMINAGRSVEDCEQYIQETMTSFIRPMKTKVARTLKNVGN